MSLEKKYTKHDENLNQFDIPYTKTKEDIWNYLSESIENEASDNKGVIITKRKSFWYSAAAVIILLIGLTAFLNLYTVELLAPKGQHISSELPDGSIVTLNAQTSLTYKPYWWKFSRGVRLSGEAFFEVKKGSKFTVLSEKGNTEVLGTSFNIFARDDIYRVHCLTGKVRVLSLTVNEILTPGHSITITKQNIMRNSSEEMKEDITAWIDNRFVFTSVPVKQVFEELERQFDIHIILTEEINDLYSGNFKRGSSPDDILKLICKPLGLEYYKTQLNTFEIKKP